MDRLKKYQGKRIAVVLSCGGVQRVFCGLAARSDDEELGAVLRIQLQQEGGDLAGYPALILQEDAPGRCLVSDDRYGCDFRMDLTTSVSPGA